MWQRCAWWGFGAAWFISTWTYIGNIYSSWKVSWSGSSSIICWHIFCTPDHVHAENPGGGGLLADMHCTFLWAAIVSFGHRFWIELFPFNVCYSSNFQWRSNPFICYIPPSHILSSLLKSTCRSAKKCQLTLSIKFMRPNSSALNFCQRRKGEVWSINSVPLCMYVAVQSVKILLIACSCVCMLW